MDCLKVALGICLFALTVLVQQGWSIDCYQCNSKFEEGCKDLAPDSEHLKPCGEEYNLCRKMDQDVKGVWRTIRQCAKEGPNKCVLRAGTHKIKVTYCQCEGDGCNAATSVTTSLTLVALLSSAVYVLLR